MDWLTRSSREVYRNDWISVREDDVIRPDGTPGLYGVVAPHRPAVFVVPVADDGQMILIRQRRYTTGMESIEVPAGGVDEGEDPVSAARRELREETGQVAGQWRDLGPVYSLNGIADAPGRVLLATELQEVGGAEQHVEGITGVVRADPAELAAMIGRNEITDSESLAALLLALVALDRLTRLGTAGTASGAMRKSPREGVA